MYLLFVAICLFVIFLTSSFALSKDTGLSVTPFASLVILVFYMIFMGLIVYRKFTGFSSTKGGNSFVDSFYIISTTTFKVGFGDIFPYTSNTTILCDMIVMLGHFVPIILYYCLRHIVDTLDQKFMPAVESEKMRLVYQVVSAICAIFASIFSWMADIYVFERDRLASGSPSPCLSPSLSPSATQLHWGVSETYTILNQFN